MPKKFDVNKYATVESRLEQYGSDNSDYRVNTDVIHYSEDDKVVIKATLYKTFEDQQAGCFHATGIAEETPEGYVNQTSRVENCETSAIGRALANAGYPGKIDDSKAPRPSREEMSKVERLTKKREEVLPDPVEDMKPVGDFTDYIDSETNKNKLIKNFNQRYQEIVDEDGDEAGEEWYNDIFPLVDAKMKSLS